MNTIVNDSLHNDRRFVLAAVLILTLFGILMVYESSSLYAYRTTQDAAYFFKRQLIFFIIGFVCFFLTLLLDLEFLRKHAKEFLFSTLIVLIILLVVGKKAGGAKRWLHLFGFNFQPSEFLKIFFSIYCIDYIVKRKNNIKKFSNLIPLGIVLSVICLVVVVQPDLGTAMFWVLWTLCMLFLYRARRKHLGLIVLAGTMIAVFLVTTHPYRFRRITGYLDPFADPRDSGFQLIQSQIAYGQGGLLGVGFGESRQKLFFLPAAHTDFIFSIIAEEFGLVGSFLMLLIFFIIFHKMYRIAKSSEDDFRRGLLFGIILIFFLETVINIGVSCGLLPTKGLPLPFISYGGSNLIAHYILLALFFNASKPQLRQMKQPKITDVANGDWL
ncbi:MAG: putative lipid II flippase FtsW [Candidatus Omnitrophota bacterium]